MLFLRVGRSAHDT